jgi:hypothetical protein
MSSNDQATNSVFDQVWGQVWIKVIDRVKAPIKKAVVDRRQTYVLRGDTPRDVWHSVGGQARDQHDDR